MSKKAIAIVAFAAFIALDPPPPAQSQIGALTVAAGGVVVSNVLKSLEEKISGIIGRAAEAASLTADAAARNLLLAVQAARQDLNRDLDTQWDRLEGKKLQLIKDLDRYADELDKNIGRLERTEELAVLDVENLIDKLPFTSKEYAIKRVDGARQIYKDSGFYRIVVRSNGLDFSGRTAEFRMGGKLFKPEALQQSRQYEVEITVPAEEINGVFQDRGLSFVDLDMSFEVPNRKFWEIWRDATRRANFTVKVQLFPKFPVSYSLRETTQTDTVDKSKIEWVSSQATVVGGCGDSGCYARHNVFAYIPNGGQATGKVKECTDSFTTHGSFIKEGVNQVKIFNITLKVPQENYCTASSGDVEAIAFTPSMVTMLYLQHSHNTSRTVQYKAAYHPLGKSDAVSDLQLQPVSAASPAPDTVAAVIANFAELKAIPEKIAAGLSGSISAKQSPSGILVASFKEPGPPVVAPAGSASLPANRPKQGLLRYGQTYEARLSNNMVAYTLAITSFNGDSIVVSESKADPKVDVQVTNMTSFKRILVTPKAPW